MIMPPDPEPSESDPGEEWEPAWGDAPEIAPDALTPVETGDDD